MLLRAVTHLLNTLRRRMVASCPLNSFTWRGVNMTPESTDRSWMDHMRAEHMAVATRDGERLVQLVHSTARIRAYECV